MMDMVAPVSLAIRWEVFPFREPPIQLSVAAGVGTCDTAASASFAFSVVFVGWFRLGQCGAMCPGVLHLKQIAPLSLSQGGFLSLGSFLYV